MLNLKNANIFHQDTIRDHGIINVEQAVVLKKLGVFQKSETVYSRGLNSNKVIFHHREKDAHKYYRKYLQDADESAANRLEIYSAFIEFRFHKCYMFCYIK